MRCQGSRLAVAASMEIDDGPGGTIEGFGACPGREGAILVPAFSHEVRIPRDPATESSRHMNEVSITRRRIRRRWEEEQTGVWDTWSAGIPTP